MKKLWEQITPQERRFVVGVAVGVFILLNYLLVWPHFSDLEEQRFRLRKAEKTVADYKKELKHKREYKARVDELQSNGGMPVPKEDQAINFDRFYRQKASENKVQVVNNSRLITTPKEFFVEQEMALSIQGEEKNLVNFLYSLGADKSLVRVRAMSLRPDAPRQELTANINIVASYQTNAPAPDAKAAKPTTPAKAPPAVAKNAPLVKAPGPAKTATNPVAAAIAARNAAQKTPGAKPQTAGSTPPAGTNSTPRFMREGRPPAIGTNVPGRGYIQQGKKTTGSSD